MCLWQLNPCCLPAVCKVKALGIVLDWDTICQTFWTGGLVRTTSRNSVHYVASSVPALVRQKQTAWTAFAFMAKCHMFWLSFAQWACINWIGRCVRNAWADFWFHSHCCEVWDLKDTTFPLSSWGCSRCRLACRTCRLQEVKYRVTWWQTGRHREREIG